MKSVILQSMTRAEREAVLARVKAARTRTKSSGRPAAISARTASRSHWPLSFAQQRLWFIAQAWPTAHTLSFGLSLRGPLNEAALQAALDRIVQRHEALRTHFEVVDGQPVQRIARTSTFSLVRHDLSGQEDGRDALEELSRVEVSTPVDVAKGPLIRGRLLRLGDQEHVLLLTTHHIVFDGWSLGVLANEFTELYRAYAVQGLSPQSDPLPPLSIQYADYALWQREWLSGEVQERQLAFWREHLADAPALVSLPTDKPRPAVQDYRGQSVPVAFDAELTASLKALSQRHGTTLYMTVLAAWGALIARLAGQDEVVIGTPVANRTRAEVEPMIGCFVNVLALRLSLSEQPSVAQLLGRVRECVLQAQSHQDLPFEQVVEALKPQRTLAHSPIFQLTFAWQNTPDETLELDGLNLQTFSPRAGEHMAQYDLELDLHEAQGRIVGTLSFASALFEAATIERYLGYLESMLRGMVRDDTQPVDAIEIMGEAERHQVLRKWNETARVYRQDVYVHELIEQQVARNPEAMAIEQGGDRLTYAELEGCANRLAHQLRAWGVQAEERVALCLPRGADLVVGMLAVLKAGGAYVPLDPAHPPQRLQQMLNDCAPRVLLTESALAQSEQLSGAWAVWALDGEQRPWDSQPASPLPRESCDAQRLAYVIYTSGSSGQPNGVMVEHRHLLNLIGWHCERFALQAGERTTSTAGVAFDACTWEVWPALCMGATLVLPPATLGADPQALLQWWEEQDLHSGFLVTALAEAALSRSPTQRRGLRTLLTGGDRLSRLPATGLPFELVNNYGPTETTVVASSGVCQADDAVVHIGRPIANTQIYLLDRYGEPVPVGAPGEIYIGGAQVARGYWKRPELTRTRFVEDPFSGAPGARMYKTGDLARRRADGQLEYLGRTDSQVKMRGLRIELGEIEAQLRRQPDVREAAVLARQDVPGEQRLVAYLVGAPGSTPDPQTVRHALAQTLPDYMVPAAYVVLDALPLTANGKLDRRALPAPQGGAFVQRAYEAPQGAVERALAQIWSELLRIERVGRNDNFFELGGHSLLAVQMGSRLSQRLNLELDISSLFDNPVLRDFSARVGRASFSSLPALVPGSRPEHLPLSFAQQRLWFISQMGSEESTAYHVVGALRLRGRLDEAALQAALDRVVQRHEALRTHFEVVDGQPVQRIACASTFTLARHDLRAYEEGLRALEDLCREESRAPFELAQGPLLRGQLVRLGEQDHVLLLTTHHIVFDGWSLGVLANELTELYRAYAVQGLAPEIDPLPELSIQYADYALWQREWLSGAVQERQLAFWREQLSDAPALVSLPTDKPRPAVHDYRGQSLPVQFHAELTTSLKALSQRHGTTLYMTVLAAWGALIARLAGQDEVVIGTPVANRTRTEVEPLIGFFVNTLAVRLDLRDQPSVAQLLERVRDRVLQAQSHQDFPFEQVVEALKPQRTLAHSPIFQLVFVWQNAPQTAFDLAGLSVEEMAVQPASAKFDLTLDLQEAQGRIVGTLSFASALFEAATIARYLGYLDSMLRAMVRDDTQPIDAIEIMGEAERHQVLRGFNATETHYPEEKRVHELFEEQVRLRPSAVAVVCEDEPLTYAQLNARANQLAHYLREQGVQPGEYIPLAMSRSLQMLIGQLAVLKSGCVYVPVDLKLPLERQMFMFNDCGAHRVLSEHARPEGLNDRSVQWVDCQAVAAAIGRMGDRNPTVPGESGSAAYVMYTSGSTGIPKGVVVPHRAVNRLVMNSGYVQIEPDDCIAHCSNVAFDASTFEIWGALLNGARTLIVPQAVVLEAERFAQVLKEQRVTIIFQTTALFNQHAATHPDVFAGLKYVLWGGELCDPKAVARILTAGRPKHLLHVYGPTESTTFATSYEVQSVADDAHSIPIGRPISNTQIYILDRRLQPVPVGDVGEIYIGGAGVALGYLNRPELTEERFIADPYGKDSRGRLYKSGDLARWRANGSIEFVGRNDHQVKIRGFRIEPGEIEATLLLHDQVKEAIVLARQDVPGEKRLVAYVTHTGTAPEIEALREHLQKALPEYMVPSAFVILDSLPLTPNGKLNRNALPAPEADSVPRREYQVPQGEVEMALAQIWSELLRIERVGRNDNFFELGGHSLLITRLVEGGRQRGLLMDLRQIFDAPTLKELAAVVKAGHHGAVTHSTLVPVRATGSRRPLFCLHEGFGSVLVYERLARLIDADIPVHSVEARAMREDVPIFRSVPDMARDYVRQIATVQPGGPYRLAGWSGGGLIAYEMAHQLLAQGESVEFVGMIDTYNMVPEDLAGEIAETKHFLIRILEYTHPHLPPTVLRALMAFDDLEAMVAECHRHGWLAPDVTGLEMSRRFKVSNDIARACVEYVAPAIALDVDLFSAQEPARLDRSNGWSRVLGPRLKITRVGGTHMSMMQDETLMAQVASPMNRALCGIGTAAPHRAQPPLHTAHTVHS